MKKHAVVALLLFSIGCSQPESGVPYASLLDSLENSNRMASLTDSGMSVETSHDRTGGNDDYNYFPYENPTGWAVFADLKGPGLLTRFWCTGGLRADRRFRFYFDGEKTPRIDTTLGEMQSGAFPFLSELARHEQSC